MAPLKFPQVSLGAGPEPTSGGRISKTQIYRFNFMLIFMFLLMARWVKVVFMKVMMTKGHGEGWLSQQGAGILVSSPSQDTHNSHPDAHTPQSNVVVYGCVVFSITKALLLWLKRKEKDVLLWRTCIGSSGQCTGFFRSLASADLLV